MENDNLCLSKKIAWQIESTKKFVYINAIGTDTFYKLEDIGKEIWMGIVEGKSILEISRSLAKQYNVTQEAIEHDIKEFVSMLVSKDLLESKPFHTNN